MNLADQQTPTPQKLREIAKDIANKAGISPDQVTIHADGKGGYTATVGGVSHSGSLKDVTDWALGEARRLAEERRADDDYGPGGM